MNPKETIPLAVAAGPLLAAAPQLLIGAAIVAGIVWLFMSDDDEAQPKGTEAEEAGAARPGEPSDHATPRKAKAQRKVMLEDLAGVFENGERSLTRAEAVAALHALGIGKTAAYNALSPSGKFAAWFDFEPDGMMTFEG